MLFNKNNVRKVNDKKVLHKVGKNWKVVSLALLLAIGGTAAATHVNANADANTNNSAILSKIAGSPSIPSGYTPVKNSNNSGYTPVKNSNNNANANVQPKHQNQNINKVNYLTESDGVTLTPGASAASYYANAQSASNIIANNSDAVKNYINSLNTQFPGQISNYSNIISSATSAENSNNALANSYSNVAKNNSASVSSEVSSLASKAGLTPSDYTSSVNSTKNSYASALSNAKKNNGSNKLFDLINNDLANPTNASENAAINSGDASAASAIANTKSSAAGDAVVSAQNAFGSNNSALISNESYSAALAAADNKALTDTNNGNLNSAYTSMAEKDFGTWTGGTFTTSESSAKVTNTQISAVSSAVSHAVSIFNSAASTAGYYAFTKPFNDSTFANPLWDNAVPVNGHNINADSNGPNAELFSEVAAKQVYASANAKITSVINSANAAVPAKTSALNSVNASSVAAHSANVSASNASVLASAENALASTIAYSGASAYDQDNIPNFLTAVSNDAEVESGNDSLALGGNYSSDMSALASAAGLNYNATGVLSGSNLASLASVTSSAIASLSASNSVSYGASNFSSALSIGASDANSNVQSLSSEASSYAKANHTNYILANSLASSYASDAKSASSSAASASKALSNFYSNNANGKLAKSANDYINAEKSINDDLALANAWAMNVYNHNVPRYINVIKKCAIHTNANFGKDGDQKLVNVPAGAQRLTVNGIGITRNGGIVYHTSYKGAEGYITNLPQYIKQTYLEPANSENVPVTRTTGAYTSPIFNKGTFVGNIDAGQIIKGAHVYSADGIRHGYTRIAFFAKGHIFYTTSNTDYVKGATNNDVTPVVHNNGNHNYKIINFEF